MTFNKLINLYNHYKNNYDFQVRKITYNELEDAITRSEEWIPE